MAVRAEVSSGSIGFGGLLFLVFLVLKLTHYIDWSWWWVTAPLWGGLVAVVAVMVFMLIVVGLGAGITHLISRSK